MLQSNSINGLQDTTALFPNTPPHNEINDLQATAADRRKGDSASNTEAMPPGHDGGEPRRNDTMTRSNEIARDALAAEIRTEHHAPQ